VKQALVVLGVLAIAVAGCGGGAQSDADVTITVFAAASLTDAFTELGEDFESASDGVAVRFSFGGSSDLVEQIRQGAPADVFASADQKNMAKLVAEGLAARTAVDFAANTLEIATPPDNPADVNTLADLVAPGVRLVVCAPEVPCGAAAVEVARVGGVTLEPVSEEQSVKDVLAKVASGEADAGLVYVTDVRAAGRAVRGVGFAEASQAVNVYPITWVEGGEHEEAAEEFVEFVLSEAGQAVLASYGFAEAP
jgi:molybdate transport system substrate-binding protein